MNKKDIALTVFGTLASFVVAYLIYKMQQRDSANAAAQAAANAAQVAANNADQANELASLPSVSVGSVSAVATTSGSASDATDVTSAAGSSSTGDATDTLIASLLNGILTSPPSVTGTGNSAIDNALIQPITGLGSASNPENNSNANVASLYTALLDTPISNSTINMEPSTSGQIGTTPVINTPTASIPRPVGVQY